MKRNDMITAGVLGLAVGDALGMPYETGRRGSFDVRIDAVDPAAGAYRMPAYRRGMPAHWYGEAAPAGCWTDDTAMTLAEMESIARLGRIDPGDIMRNFARWHFEGAFSATGTAVGQGRQTVNALVRYQNGTPAAECGGASVKDNGDGSLMRMLPFVFCEELLSASGITVGELSSLTHAHPISKRACEIYVRFARELIGSGGREGAAETLKGLDAPYERLYGIGSLQQSDIRSSGYVVDALEAALWSFLTTESYTDCVLTAVNLGGDTDTIAAIAGSLAGLRHGAGSIPQNWCDALCGREMIDRITEDFCGAILCGV